MGDARCKLRSRTSNVTKQQLEKSESFPKNHFDLSDLVSCANYVNSVPFHQNWIRNIQVRSKTAIHCSQIF